MTIVVAVSVCGEHARGLTVPAYQSAGAAGFDLVAAAFRMNDRLVAVVDLHPGERVLALTGLQFEIPAGYEGQVRPRSGLALKHGVSVLNAPGTIDSDFRGEVGVILVNTSNFAVRLSRGDRVAQMVVAPVVRARLVVHDTLTPTVRGERGFGSTGV